MEDAVDDDDDEEEEEEVVDDKCATEDRVETTGEVVVVNDMDTDESGRRISTGKRRKRIMKKNGKRKKEMKTDGNFTTFKQPNRARIACSMITNKYIITKLQLQNHMITKLQIYKITKIDIENS